MLLKAHVKKFPQLRIKQLDWLMGFISQNEMNGSSIMEQMRQSFMN